ncbi:hypothetical protein TNCV_3697081 [Trichonephila clavipes]|uniref:Uncharacterized protein n=1 Tax=Trichonephila clavipes TaxID=2585209 RepID=A0A8X6SAV5_TRICX|nr:hypothetical protein TNCV_3697081 [Trichonephila clavipes]
MVLISTDSTLGVGARASFFFVHVAYYSFSLHCSLITIVPGRFSSAIPPSSHNVSKKEAQSSRGFGVIRASESNGASTDDSSDEKVPANNLLERSPDSEEDDEEIEQDPGCRSLYLENTAFPTSGCCKSKVIRQ